MEAGCILLKCLNRQYAMLYLSEVCAAINEALQDYAKVSKVITFIHTYTPIITTVIISEVSK